MTTPPATVEEADRWSASAAATMVGSGSVGIAVVGRFLGGSPEQLHSLRPGRSTGWWTGWWSSTAGESGWFGVLFELGVLPLDDQAAAR